MKSLLVIALLFVALTLAPARAIVVDNGASGGFIPPSVAVLLRGGFMSKTAQELVPLLEIIALSLKIPGNKTEHLSYGNISLSEFHLNGLNVSLHAPNIVALGFTNVSLALPWTNFSISDKFLGEKIECSGALAASSEGTNMTQYIELGKNASTGHLDVVNVTSDVAFGMINFTNTVEGTQCQNLEKLFDKLVGNINELAVKLVEKMLPQELEKVVQNVADKVFDSIPVTLAEQPMVNNESMEVDLVLLAPPGSNPHIVPPSFAQFPPRDLEMYVPATSFNDILSLLDIFGKLNVNDLLPSTMLNTSTFARFWPSVEAKCPGCPFEAKLSAPVAPFVSFSAEDGAVLHINAEDIGLVAINPANNDTFPVLKIALNLTVEILNIRGSGSDGATILFDIAIPTFSVKQLSSSVGPLPVQLLDNSLRFILQTMFVPAFNKNFKGIPIPPLGGFITVDDFVFSLQDDQFGVAMNIVL